MEDDFYLKSVKTLYKGYQDIIGDAAVGILRRNNNITLNEENEIESFDGGKEELGEFIEDFKQTIGEVAIRIGKQKIEAIETDKELPEILKGE